MAVKASAKTKGFTLETYGWSDLDWTGRTQLDVELFFFTRKAGSRILPNGTKYANGHSRGWHFKRCAQMIWGPHNAKKVFVWHPWADTMLANACLHKRLAVAGCGNSGKSDFFAIWAILNFLARPTKCMVLVTSTTKSAAGNRIWGKVVSYWNAITGVLPPGQNARLPGEIVSSKYCIRYVDHSEGKSDETVGIKLVAGEASKASRSADEIRGIKGDPLILICDEMAELSHSLTNTFDENLTANYNHQIIGIANPDTLFDPFGEMCEPPEGYDSVSDEDFEWMAKKDTKVIRFDAELSPNILEGQVIYPFLMRSDQLAEKERNLGGRFTPAYYRGVRGFFCPTGNELTVYTQLELMASKAKESATWMGDTTMVGGFDVSHTHEGDRSVLSVGKIGYRTDGVLTLEYQGHVEINEDVRTKDVDRTTQIVRKLRKECEIRGIALRNLGTDATGPGGKAFRDAMIAQWGSDFLPVDFAGACSDGAVSNLDPTPCKERYDRKVSEIWFAGKQMIRCDQLRGMKNELACEMVLRKYKDGRKIAVETKRDMKGRTKKSPDISDAFFCMTALCRERHNFVSKEKSATAPGSKKDPVKDAFRKFQDCAA